MKSLVRPLPGANRLRLLLAIIAVMFMISVIPLQAGESGWERFQVLAKRNMFAKDRARERDRYAQNSPQSPAAKAEPDALVLTGIVDRDGKLVAFIENRRTALIQELEQGAEVAAGKVKAFTLDGLEYECKGESRKVHIGDTLDGSPTPAYAEPAKAASAPAAAPTTSTIEQATQPATSASSRPSRFNRQMRNVQARGADSTASTSAATPQTTSQPTEAASQPANSADTEAILERLRAKRQKEMEQ